MKNLNDKDRIRELEAQIRKMKRQRKAEEIKQQREIIRELLAKEKLSMLIEWLQERHNIKFKRTDDHNEDIRRIQKKMKKLYKDYYGLEDVGPQPILVYGIKKPFYKVTDEENRIRTAIRENKTKLFLKQEKFRIVGFEEKIYLIGDKYPFWLVEMKKPEFYKEILEHVNLYW